MNRSAARILFVAAALASAASLLTCRRNNPPDTPGALNWPPAVWRDSVVEYRVVVSDIDGDEVAVRFEWADSTVSDWSAPYPSGETIAVTHTWDSVGSYNVRVQARDEHEKVSWWTDYFVQMVILRQPPLAPSTPVGPVKGGVDSVYTFTSIADDSSPTRVSIRFDWGNGDTSGWSEIVAAGETVAMTHAWPVADTYAIRAMCRDTAGTPSPWSEPDSFVVRPVDTLRKWRAWLGTHEVSHRAGLAIDAAGVIYFAHYDSTIFAFNPDGSPRWRRAMPEGSKYSSPSIGPDGTVYIGLEDNTLYALLPDGGTRWSVLLPMTIRSTPAIDADGTLYIAAHDSFFAVSPGGTIAWRADLDDYARSSPVIGIDGKVYICNHEGLLFAFDRSGILQWQEQLSVNPFAGYSSPAVGADGTVYQPTRGMLLSAVTPEGTVLWQYSSPELQGADYSSPAVGPDGAIYIGCRDEALYAVNPVGTLRWRFLTGGNIRSTPAIAADGTVYFGSADSCLYAVNSDGSLKWRYETGRSIYSSPAIAPDGTVYFVSTDGWLYALKGTAPLADSPWPKFHHDARNTGRAGAQR